MGSLMRPSSLRNLLSLFLGAAEGDFSCRLSLGKMRQPRRLFSLVEQLVEGNLKRMGQLLQGFDRRNRVAVLDSGNISTQQAGALFDVTLRDFLDFTDGAQAVANEPGLRTNFFGSECLLVEVDRLGSTVPRLRTNDPISYTKTLGRFAGISTILPRAESKRLRIAMAASKENVLRRERASGFSTYAPLAPMPHKRAPGLGRIVQ